MPDNSAPTMSSDARWYYSHSGNVIGPMPLASIRALWQAKELPSDTLGTPEGSEDWQPLTDVLGAFTVPSSPPALPTTAEATPESPSSAEKWFERTGIVLACLFCCFPAGLAFLWQSRRFSHPMKIGLTVAVALMVLPVLLQMPKETRQREAREKAERERIANLSPSEAIEHRVEPKLKALFGDKLGRLILRERPETPGAFAIEIEFEGRQAWDAPAARRDIERGMADAYEIAFGEPSIDEASCSVCLPLTDKFGKVTTDVVYKTSMNREVASRVNWQSKRLLRWPELWKAHFIHPALRAAE